MYAIRSYYALKAELPNIRTFATLSPIPGYRKWIESLDSSEISRRLGDDDLVELGALCGELDIEINLVDLLRRPDWSTDNRISSTVRPLLEKLLCHYFHETRSDGQPIDPVERFHLGNGARIEQVNWLGDVSEKGMQQSYGLMVNYLYAIKEIEKNHELYADKRKIVVSSGT